MSKKLLIIDAGHNEYVAGKRSPDSSLMEYEFNHDIGNVKLRKRAETHGILVFLTNPSPFKKNEIGLSKRCSLANNEWSRLGKPDALFLSVHANAYGSGWNDANGTETWISLNASSKSKNAAKCVNDQMVVDLGTKNRGVKSENYAVIKNTNMPGILIEVGFYSNKKDVNILKNRRDDITESIMKGICKHFGIKYIPPTGSTNDTNVSKPSVFVKGDYNKPVKITSNELTVRDGRGVEFKNLGIFKKGEIVDVWHISNAKDGGLWGSCGFNGKTGFINMAYVEPTNEKPKPPTPTVKPIAVGDYNAPLKVTTDSLNVRSGRGTKFKVVSTLKKGQVIDAWKIEKGDDGKLWTSFRYAPSNTAETKGVGYCSCDFLTPSVK